MVAGINNASNSKQNKKNTTDVAWSPAPPKKEKKGDTPGVGLYILKRKYTNYRVGGGDKSFEDWRKTQ